MGGVLPSEAQLQLWSSRVFREGLPSRDEAAQCMYMYQWQRRQAELQERGATLGSLVGFRMQGGGEV